MDSPEPIEPDTPTPRGATFRGAVWLAGMLGLGFMGGVIVATIQRPPFDPPKPAPIALSKIESTLEADQTYFVVFDRATDVLRTEGWSPAEVGGGLWFAWCAQQRCTVQVPNVQASGDQEVAFAAAPFDYPDAPEQQVEVLLNGASLGSRAMRSGLSVTLVPARKALWREGQNELTFNFAYAQPPEAHAEQADARKLSAAFRWLVINGGRTSTPPSSPSPQGGGPPQ